MIERERDWKIGENRMNTWEEEVNGGDGQKKLKRKWEKCLKNDIFGTRRMNMLLWCEQWEGANQVVIKL